MGRKVLRHLRWASAAILVLAGPGAVRSEPASDTAATLAVARPFLRALFQESDPARAYTTYGAPDMTEHNPEMADGVAAHVAFFANRHTADPVKYPPPSTWANVADNVLIDGDLIAVQHHGFMTPQDRGRVFVDMWRVANGKIVEHWDVIQPVPIAPRNANTMWCGRGSDYASAKALGDTLDHPSCGSPDPNASREASLAVLRDYLAAVGKGDVRAAVERWTAPNYIQHSPEIADGIAGAEEHLLAEFARGPAATPRATLVHTIAVGDLVLYYRHVIHPDDGRDLAQVDIFRVKDGKIAEHWDVKQPVPATSKNANTMFVTPTKR